MDSKILPEVFPTRANHPGAFTATTTLCQPRHIHCTALCREQENSPGLKHLLTIIKDNSIGMDAQGQKGETVKYNPEVP